jgi:nucleoid-associated protein YgaU
MGTHVRGSGMFRDAAAPRRFRRSRGSRRSGVLGAALAVAAGGLVLAAGVAYGGATSGPQHVTIHAGDTLWGLASSHYAGDDVQGRIAQIEAVNHLRSPALRPGQTLTLPAP